MNTLASVGMSSVGGDAALVLQLWNSFSKLSTMKWSKR